MVNGRTDAEDMERQYQLASLRDTFAAAALTGFIRGMPSDSIFHLGLMAKQSYEVADAMLRERNGAVESRETVRDGVVPTATWFDLKIAEECRIAQAEAARLRLTNAEREAIDGIVAFLFGLSDTCVQVGTRQTLRERADTLRNLLERLK